MTREEAVADIESKISRINEIMETGEYGCVDIENWNHWQRRLEWHEGILDALKPPTPDPDTGLMPCGCGGKAKITEQSLNWLIKCVECGIQLEVYGGRGGAVWSWNRAMGWEGDAALHTERVDVAPGFDSIRPEVAHD